MRGSLRYSASLAALTLGVGLSILDWKCESEEVEKVKKVSQLAATKFQRLPQKSVGERQYNAICEKEESTWGEYYNTSIKERVQPKRKIRRGRLRLSFISKLGGVYDREADRMGIE